MANGVKWTTHLGSKLLIICGAVLGTAVCANASDQGNGEAVRSAAYKYEMLTCEEIEKRYGDKVAVILTDEILAADLQSMLDDPEFRRLMEEEATPEEAVLEEMRCLFLTATWGIGVQGAFRHFLETIPAAKRATVEERLFFYSLEQNIEASTRGKDIRGGTLQETLDEVLALLEDYLSPEELEVLTVGSMMRMQEIEGTRMFLDALFRDEDLAEHDAQAIAIAFGHEQGHAYAVFFADPENTNLNEELIASYERAMRELSDTLSPEAMGYAERLFEFYMKAREIGD